MKCARCKATVESGARFCAYCGTKSAAEPRLAWDDPALAVASDPPLRRKYRLLQSWYREHVLDADYGYSFLKSPRRWAACSHRRSGRPGTELVRSRSPVCRRARPRFKPPRNAGGAPPPAQPAVVNAHGVQLVAAVGRLDRERFVSSVWHRLRRGHRRIRQWTPERLSRSYQRSHCV